ncbi:MAG: hypothetical protein JWO03_2221 [Bacteroidetes bacterium]|nr:hypothetical protein [Bacteroidota bacterium]
MSELKLFMILIGYRPKGFNTEQHDVIFHIGTNVEEPATLQQIRSTVPLPKSVLVHIDTYVEVTQADGYAVSVSKEKLSSTSGSPRLYYVNLGGYRKGIFQEFHKSILLALDNPDDLKKRALADSFATEMDSDFASDAKPHVDDRMKLGVDIDDVLDVQQGFDDYYITLTSNPGGKDSIHSPVIKGYLKLEF